jgi:acyl phosphate:glycerol-3-phosphate acyltransferase
VDIVVCLIAAAVAYLLGSIPTGFLVGKAMGVDVRKVGSGNIGATNAFRILGKRAGAFVLVVDGLKGWVAAAKLPELVYRIFFPSGWSDEKGEYLQIIAGVVVILGHNYTCWLKFKGGKGIATSAGVMAALMPITFIISLSTWIVVLLVTRYVSVASILAALVLPFAAWGAGYSYRKIAIAAILGGLAIYKHKANIDRLMKGTENKVGRKKDPPASGVIS